MKSAERANARKTIPPMIVTMETSQENNISITTQVNRVDVRGIFSQVYWNSLRDNNKKRGQNLTRSDRYLLGDHSPSDHGQSCAQTVSQGPTYRHSKRILGILEMKNDFVMTHKQRKPPKDKYHVFVCGLKVSRDVISLALARPEGEIQTNIPRKIKRHLVGNGEATRQGPHFHYFNSTILSSI